jgi:hypothetical protein
MDFALLLVGPLLGSAAIGFALNRFVLTRITNPRAKALAFAASRAIFYAPSLEHMGHGVHLPLPLLLVLVYSQTEFGPQLGLLTFLLPTVVLAGSLATSYSKRLGLWFSALVATHLVLLGILPFLLPAFDARLKLFEVNALPWYPLHHFFKLPVTEYGWLTLPNEIGWIWCFAVWLAFYAVLATASTRLTLRSTGRAKSGARVS